MPLHEMKPGDPKVGATRLQIIGPPASYKTTIAATFDKPEIIVGLPGEKHTDILTPSNELKVLLFEAPDYSNANFDWLNLWNDIRRETGKIVRGDYGACTTLVLDGTHKAFYACYLAGKQKHATANGGWNGLQGWPWINDEFLAWFSQAFYSALPWVVWTAWSAREQTEEEKQQAAGKAATTMAVKRSSILPDYMGKFQRTCMGETNIIYQFVEGGRAYWQIRQTEDCQGIGLRVAPERAMKLPLKIQAEWKVLKDILQPSTQEVKA